jgi:hypothetical protein
MCALYINHKDEYSTPDHIRLIQGVSFGNSMGRYYKCKLQQIHLSKLRNINTRITNFLKRDLTPQAKRYPNTKKCTRSTEENRGE